MEQIIYKPTDAVEQAYRNLLKIPTLKAIADYKIRDKYGERAGLDAEDLHLFNEYTEPNKSDSEPSANVFGFYGGKQTQKKKRTQKKTNKQK